MHICTVYLILDTKIIMEKALYLTFERWEQFPYQI